MAKTETRPKTIDELAGLHHQQGCPQTPDRIESYTARRPDGTPLRVTRCQDCAAGAVAELDESDIEPEGDA